MNTYTVYLQSMGKVPTINVEKTDVAQIFLSKSSIDAEIVTAKSSAVNVSVPDATGDFVSAMSLVCGMGLTNSLL